MPRIVTALVFGCALSGCALLGAKSNDARLGPASSVLPTTAESWFQLGNFHAENGRLAEAERAYQEALKIGDDPKILHNLGLVQIRLGVAALQEARRRLPATDPVLAETRRYLRALAEEGL